MKTFAEQIIQQTGTLVVVLDKNGKAEYVSPTSEEMLGFRSDMLLGDGWLNYTRSREEVAITQIHLEEIRASKSAPASYERMLRTAQGGTKHILWNAKPAGDGKIVAIGYDITERKHKELLLERKSKELSERNKEMESSLRYAQRIQAAILPEESRLRVHFENSFVYYRPKDIVSGDFWWIHETTDFIYVAAVDCTGHGVPGALMSVLAHSIFREVFINKQHNSTGEILEQLDSELFNVLNGNHAEYSCADGMDVALVRFEKHSGALQYSGALRPLLIVRGETCLEITPTRYPLGFFSDARKSFHTNEIELQEGDWIYLFSDGYADQFGGEKNKKLNKARFRELLVTASQMNGEEQKGFLEYSHRNWRQNEEQTDDVVIIGISPHFGDQTRKIKA